MIWDDVGRQIQREDKDNRPSTLTTKSPSIVWNSSDCCSTSQNEAVQAVYSIIPSSPSDMALYVIWIKWYLANSFRNVAVAEHAEGAVVTFYFLNLCPFTIWPATAPNAGQAVIADGGFSLKTGKSKRVQAPDTWSGRFWARTECDFTSKPACQTGDCQGRFACNGTIGMPPATLVEVSLLPTSKSNLNFYDVSLVDGYNLPVSVSAVNAKSNCFVEGCLKNINSVCPVELQVLNDGGTVVACKSACLAFNLDTFCCRNAYGSPEKCQPNMYSKMFKDACPSYSSYAFDKPSPVVSCTSKEYIITFCPSPPALGDHVHAHVDE
ncbi:thaumatin-like protein [Telopea speciosissima]|uniref:thaumatin-like protein n=1 Tax=Telopea speciosissima TaxID=54955 RepID=UPI001CC5EA06|nr:thaumatin-like protein [Telopea speciosissima]